MALMVTLYSGKPIPEELGTQPVLRGVLEGGGGGPVCPLLDGDKILVGGIWTWDSMDPAIW